MPHKEIMSGMPTKCRLDLCTDFMTKSIIMFWTRMKYRPDKDISHNPLAIASQIHFL